MLGHRLQRWPSIEPTFGARLVSADLYVMSVRRDVREHSGK